MAERTTPRLTDHARERCVEMGVSTKRAKRIVQQPDIVRPGTDGATLAVADFDPDIAVVYKESDRGDGTPVIITVLWRTLRTIRPKDVPPLSDDKRPETAIPEQSIEFGFCTACNQRTPANQGRCFLCGCTHEPDDDDWDEDENGS